MSQTALSAIDELEAEHTVIKRLLSAMDAATPERVDAPFFARAVEVIATFADGLHHEKEEQYLFPLLAQRGVLVKMGPIGVMLAEREQAREHVARMRDLIAADDVVGLCREGRSYVELMRGHILKEDMALFPMARSVLSEKDKAQLREAFDAIQPDATTALQPNPPVDALLEASAGE